MESGGNVIKFKVNNGGSLSLIQHGDDEQVHVVRFERAVAFNQRCVIPPGDMVMLINLYQHIKENDIQNDFINPNGKNKE